MTQQWNHGNWRFQIVRVPGDRQSISDVVVEASAEGWLLSSVERCDPSNVDVVLRRPKFTPRPMELTAQPTQ